MELTGRAVPVHGCALKSELGEVFGVQVSRAEIELAVAALRALHDCRCVGAVTDWTQPVSSLDFHQTSYLIMAERNDSQSRFLTVLQKLKSIGGLKHISCEICLREITRLCYIKCAVCDNLCVCVNCFASARNKGSHTTQHPYQVIDPLKFPVLDPSWTAREEVMLLEGLQMFGYGNWTCVAEFLGTRRTPGDCEMHYYQYYLHSPTAPLPVTDAILSYRSATGEILTDLSKATLPPTIQEERLNMLPAITEPEKPPLSEFPGYLPRRRDFEVEYENDAEVSLADLEMYDDDRSDDRIIKFRALDMYNALLDEREERKQFVMERWPIEYNFEKKLRPQEKTIYQMLKPFARLIPADKLQTLCKAMAQEAIFRMKIEELREAKSLGLRSEGEFKQRLALKRSTAPSKKQRDLELLSKEGFRYKAAMERQTELQLTEAGEPAALCEYLGITEEEWIALQVKLSEQIAARGQAEGQDVVKLFDYVARFLRSPRSS